MKKGFKLISAFLVSFMIMMSSVMPAFADETDTSTTGDLLDKIQDCLLYTSDAADEL